MLEAREKIKLGSVMWKGVQSKRKNDLKGSVRVGTSTGRWKRGFHAGESTCKGPEMGAVGHV